MAFIFIYSPSDFVAGLPDEVGSNAAGTPTYTLTLVPGATPTVIEISDDDLVFNEIDASQVLTSAANVDGTPYAAGTTVHKAYDLINSTSGHKITSVHFGGDGYEQGAVHGIASTVKLTAGSSYTFDTERTSYTQNNLYDDYVACFAAKTQIRTDHGLIEVQHLKSGDLVLTLDHGYQPLRMILNRYLSTAELSAKPKLRPVRVMAGALGSGLPERDLLVSPQHRFLANSPIVERMFGEKQALISATKLTALPGIFVCEATVDVEYFHLVLDQHEVLLAEGAPAESYYCGPMAINALSLEAQREMQMLFPELGSQLYEPSQARYIPCTKKQTKFAFRHGKNCKPMLKDRFSTI